MLREIPETVGLDPRGLDLKLPRVPRVVVGEAFLACRRIERRHQAIHVE
jgi:hypothetical protein